MAAFRKVSEDQTDFQSLVKNDVYSFDDFIDLEDNEPDGFFHTLSIDDKDQFLLRPIRNRARRARDQGILF
jgi:hypothetical protein